jgi:anaerobic selenocysteine-containing dehydrogenase
LRRLHSDPIAIVHQETASKLGIDDGDWIYIETAMGRIKQKVSLSTSVDERVVVADLGWWFPEKGISELYGWAESNYNVLTDNKPPFSPDIGSANLRGLLCKIYKSQK